MKTQNSILAIALFVSFTSAISACGRNAKKIGVESSQVAAVPLLRQFPDPSLEMKEVDVTFYRAGANPSSDDSSVSLLNGTVEEMEKRLIQALAGRAQLCKNENPLIAGAYMALENAEYASMRGPTVMKKVPAPYQDAVKKEMSDLDLARQQTLKHPMASTPDFQQKILPVAKGVPMLSLGLPFKRDQLGAVADTAAATSLVVAALADGAISITLGPIKLGGGPAQQFASHPAEGPATIREISYEADGGRLHFTADQLVEGAVVASYKFDLYRANYSAPDSFPNGAAKDGRFYIKGDVYEYDRSGKKLRSGVVRMADRNIQTYLDESAMLCPFQSFAIEKALAAPAAAAPAPAAAAAPLPAASPLPAQAEAPAEGLPRSGCSTP